MNRQYRTSVASRERNRIHARKTCLRKKEQMQTLQGKADELKAEQIRLKQVINDKNTANILVGLFATSSSSKSEEARGVSSVTVTEDPQIEELLRRPTSDIPDSTNITELPSLILPGQHASKKMKVSSSSRETAEAVHDDGIDYDLLGKDRAACTPEELDQIRRERNRMHAKRTRDRKRIFMEELAEICRKLEEENDILRSHLYQLDPECTKDEHVMEQVDSDDDSEEPESTGPSLLPNAIAPLAPKNGDADHVSSSFKSSPSPSPRRQGVTFDQIQTLLEAATRFDLPAAGNRAYASVSSDDSNDESTLVDSSHRQLVKRRRLDVAPVTISSSMTSTKVGC